MKLNYVLLPVVAALVACSTVANVQAQSSTYTVEPTHTFVTFEAKHFGTSTARGRWEKKDGTISIDRAAKTGKADISIDMESLSTGVEPFNKHLKSADFFNTAVFPKASFVATKFTFDGDKVSKVEGELSLKDKINPVTLTALNFNCYNHPVLKKEVCGGDFETTIKRSLWGITYGIPFVPDDVRVVIQIEGVKQ